jgi:hypothetical protein
MKRFIKKSSLLSLFAILTIGVTSCSDNSDEESELSSPPTVTIISPKDSIPLSDKVIVEVLFTDNSGLVSTEISLGNIDQGNLVYHYSQRGLSGLSDDLSFQADIPTTVDAQGENYILVKCLDEDGNETFVEGIFYLQDNDLLAPQINILGPQGILTNDASTSMSVSYDVSDDKGLDSLNISFIESFSNGTLGTVLISKSVNFNGQLNAMGTEFILGDPNLQVSTAYKVKATLFDQAGNSSELILPTVYFVF